MWNMKDLNHNYTTKMMKMMEKIVKDKISRFRKENLDNYLGELRKKPSYDKNLMNQKLSPTVKSPSKSFSRINEHKSRDKYDLENIIRELEND